MSAQAQVLFSDPEFSKLSPEAQRIVLQRKVPSYGALSPEAQDIVFKQLSAQPLEVSRQGLSAEQIARIPEAGRGMIAQTPTQFEQDRTPQGFLTHLGQSAKSLIPSPETILRTLVGTVAPGFTARPAAEATVAEYGRAREAGYGIPYSTAAAAGGALPVPISAQRSEQAAAQGDPWGVVGEAALPAVAALAGIKEVREPLAHPIARRIEAIPKVIQAFEEAPKHLRSEIHDVALNVRDHITSVSAKVKAEAGQQMQTVSKGVDAALPEGIEAAPIRTVIRKDLGELVKIKQSLPESLQKILQSKTPQAKTTGPAVGGRTFDLSNPNDLKAFNNMKAQGVFTPDELARVAGGMPKTHWGFEELKQLRTDLGHEIWARGIDNGPVRVAAIKAYDHITELGLNPAADKAGFGAQWTQANKSWSRYVQDFWRSPIKNIAKGENAAQVFKPLSGNAAEQVSRILDRYKDRGFDKPGVEAAIEKFQRSADAVSRGKATRYDYGILAATGFSWLLKPGLPLVSLGYEAGRFGIPRAQQISLTRQMRKTPPLKTLEKKPE